MNVMYYRMVNGYHAYYPSSAVASPAGTGLVGTGTRHNGATSALAATNGTALAGATGATASLMPKWVVPGFSATQIQYMFRHRMDKGAKVNKAVKCETCGITLNSEQQAKQHYSGKNHLKKLRGIGKKKEGKDGEDSDKESEHRKFRDRKNRKRDKVINGDGSKTSERDESSSEVKDDKDSQSEGEKLDVAVDKQENTDSSNDKTIIEHQSDELDNVNNCVESPDNCEMQKESEAISSCQSGDLVQLEGLNAECKNSIPNLSQNQDGESMDSVRDSGVNDVVPRAYDGAGFAASNCDKARRTSPPYRRSRSRPPSTRRRRRR